MTCGAVVDPWVVDVDVDHRRLAVTVISAVVERDSCSVTLAVASRVTVAFFWTWPKPESVAVTLYWPGGTLGNR